jgi:phosphatidate cytidylyltransferase
MISFTYFNNIGVIDLPLGLIVILILLLLFIYHIVKYNYQDLIVNIGLYLFGLLYIAGGMSMFILLRNLEVNNFFNTGALWLALIATWSTDSGAYFIGNFFGKRKLVEKISPNKTIEGALGGIVFTITAVIIFAFILELYSISWLFYGIFVAIIAITGDLFESSLKRDMDIKDSGKLIPGHGGILDRFDSLLFTIPFTYYFLTLLL